MLCAMHWKDIAIDEVINMGGGKSKLKAKQRDNSRAYRSNAGGNGNYERKHTDNTLAETKGYDDLTENTKENRGRKKKK